MLHDCRYSIDSVESQISCNAIPMQCINWNSSTAIWKNYKKYLNCANKKVKFCAKLWTCKQLQIVERI